jgi:cell division protein FtsL
VSLWRLLPVALLGMALLATCATLVVVRQSARQQFVDLQAEQRTRATLEEEWARLQIEQATWGANGRVEELARLQLGMQQPEPADVVMVRR